MANFDLHETQSVVAFRFTTECSSFPVYFLCPFIPVSMLQDEFLYTLLPVFHLISSI